MNILRAHLESFHLTVEPSDKDFNNKEACVKQLRRFIADRLSGFFPIKCEQHIAKKDIGHIDDVEMKKTFECAKVYKIDLDKVFRGEADKLFPYNKEYVHQILKENKAYFKQVGNFKKILEKCLACDYADISYLKNEIRVEIGIKQERDCDLFKSDEC